MTQGRLVVSGENRLFREGLKQIIECPSITVVGDVRTLSRASDLLKRTEPKANLLLCDPSENPTEEFATMDAVSSEFPDLAIVVLTNDISYHWLSLALKSGAKGFLPNDISPAALQTLLELLLLDENIFAGPGNMSMNRSGTRVVPLLGQQLKIPLSPKESEILTCLGNGLPNKVIARNLNIAEETVKVHLKSLLRKINVENRTQAAIWGLNNGVSLANHDYHRLGVEH